MEKTRAIRLAASYEQAEEITEHFLRGGPVTIVPSERERLARSAQCQFPGCRILKADLDVEHGDWTLTIEVQ